jgi:hypothetical protein
MEFLSIMHPHFASGAVGVRSATVISIAFAGPAIIGSFMSARHFAKLLIRIEKKWLNKDYKKSWRRPGSILAGIAKS